MHQTSATSNFDFLHPPSHSDCTLDRRRGITSAQNLKLPTPAYLEAPIRDGLRTPPEDDMGTAYQNPQYGSYVPRPDLSFQAGGRPEGYSTAYTVANPHVRSSSNLSQPPMSSQAIIKQESSTTYPQYSRPPSPQVSSGQHTQSAPSAPQQKQSTEEIAPNLRIPHTISPAGGSLAEFAAQITCLFWFESTETLKEAENVTPTTIVPRLKPEAIPSSGFRKWVVTILTTTQVTQNVILLALLFIYRLKKINPAVKGKIGSEYRLLTVALMLGNKFLDDNTYTNKTWADVSGISVTEIHVMEVEFLSNMRYSLLASKEQWAEWQTKLSKFWLYCENAGRTPPLHYSPQGISVLQQPVLPSPPISLQLSPPALMAPHPLANSSLNVSNQWSNPVNSLAKKRSFDGDIEEPAAKRSRPQTTIPTQYPSVAQPTRREMQPLRHDAPRLPVPNLTISTSLPTSNGYNATALNGNVPLLPPLSGRAMSTVYPTSSQAWTPQPLLTPTASQPAQLPSGYSTPTRRHSPRSVQELLSHGSSPISAHFPQNPSHLSPSFFLQQRSSPYKPVRHVNTLLYPPPSASMHDYAANVEQMRYQPLGRRNDYRPGVVPHYPQSAYQYDPPAIQQPNFDVNPHAKYLP